MPVSTFAGSTWSTLPASIWALSIRHEGREKRLLCKWSGGNIAGLNWTSGILHLSICRIVGPWRNDPRFPKPVDKLVENPWTGKTGTQARWIWLDCWPTAASPICLRLYHPISQAAGGNWVHCSHCRISWIESFIIWITMNVNEPHICTWVMGENISLLAIPEIYSASPNILTALGHCFVAFLKVPHMYNQLTFPLPVFFFALLHSSAFFIELNWTEHSGLQLRECCDGVVMSCYPHSMCICMSRCTGAHAHSRNLCCEWQERAGRIVSILHFELFMQNKCIQIPRHVFSLIKERLWLHVGQSLWTVMSHSMTVRPHHQPSQP